MDLFLNKIYSREQLMGLLESILFVTGKPIGVEKICTWFSISPQFLSEIVEALNNQYTERMAGFYILCVANGYQLMTNPFYKEEIKRLLGSHKDENKLSQTVMEILAIIAYKQPISKEEVDKIRGVNSVRSLNILLGHKLIDIVGTDHLLDQILYGTSKRFLEIFRINSLSDLPLPEHLELNGLLKD